MRSLVESFATPVAWILLLTAVGLFLLRSSGSKRRRLGWRLVLAAGVVLLALSSDPVASLLAYPLEAPYPYPDAQTLASLDLVVVLGGGIRPAGGLRPFDELSGCTAQRVCAGVSVFKHSDARVLAFCGDGTAMRDLAIQLGVPPERIVAETTSRNTMENATRLAALIPGADRRIGLVTCALHVRRAESAFKKVFPRDTIIPIPVDHGSEPFKLTAARLAPSIDALVISSSALHEWIGIAWYAVRYE